MIIFIKSNFWHPQSSMIRLSGRDNEIACRKSVFLVVRPPCCFCFCFVFFFSAGGGDDGGELRESENFPSHVSKWGPRGGGWYIYKLVLVPTDPIFRGFFSPLK